MQGPANMVYAEKQQRNLVFNKVKLKDQHMRLSSNRHKGAMPRVCPHSYIGLCIPKQYIDTYIQTHNTYIHTYK